MGRLGWDDVRGALSSRAPVRVAAEVGRRAAVALVLRDGPSGIELLFIRRADHPEDPWSGQMAFPGGRSELPGALWRADLRSHLGGIAAQRAHRGRPSGSRGPIRACIPGSGGVGYLAKPMSRASAH